MPPIEDKDVLAHLSDSFRSFTGGTSSAAERMRREAWAMVKDGGLIRAAYSYSIVKLDRPAAKGDPLLYVGGGTLAAPMLIPESGKLTALVCAVATVGDKIERRIQALFAEKRASLGIALDELANQLLFAAFRYAGDQISADVFKRKLTMAGELHAGDPGLELDAQDIVLRLAQAGSIGIELNSSYVMTPLKSGSMVIGVGIDLPAATWSRCDQCPSRARGKCRLAADKEIITGMGGSPAP